jgi:uncharacterized protein
MVSGVPALGNADAQVYMEGARERRLMLQRCRDCASVHFPPRFQCPTCWRSELDWFESLGTGTIESFTVVRRAPTSAFRDKVPYVVAAVILAEGPRMITNLIGEDALAVNVGDSVRVDFQDFGDGQLLPQFRRAT